MRAVLTIVLLVVFAPFASATENDLSTIADKDVQATVVTTQTQLDAGALTVEPVLTEAKVLEKAPATEAAAQPQNRQWWWIVGAVVVGGLALVLLGVL